MAENEMKEKVQEVLARRVSPLLEADNGGIELVEVDEANGEVKVRLQGACAGCPGAQMTMSMGVEAILKEEIPEIKRVVAV